MLTSYLNVSDSGVAPVRAIVLASTPNNKPKTLILPLDRREQRDELERKRNQSAKFQQARRGTTSTF